MAKGPAPSGVALPFILAHTACFRLSLLSTPYAGAHFSWYKSFPSSFRFAHIAPYLGLLPWIPFFFSWSRGVTVSTAAQIRAGPMSPLRQAQSPLQVLVVELSTLASQHRGQRVDTSMVNFSSHNGNPVRNSPRGFHVHEGDMHALTECFDQDRADSRRSLWDSSPRRETPSA